MLDNLETLALYYDQAYMQAATCLVAQMNLPFSFYSDKHYVLNLKNNLPSLK